MRNGILTAEAQRHRGYLRRTFVRMSFSFSLLISLCLCASVVNIFAQDVVPAPGPARAVNIPAVQERKLKNGLTVAVIEKKGVPIVTSQLLVRAGASSEPSQKAGLANLTAAMLTKGTTTRTAEQIAEEMEFLGGSIGSGRVGTALQLRLA